MGGPEAPSRGTPLPLHLEILQEKVSQQIQVHETPRINVLSLTYLNLRDTPCDFTQTLRAHASLSRALRQDLGDQARATSPRGTARPPARPPITVSRKPTTAPPPGSPRARVHCHLWCPRKTRSQRGHRQPQGQPRLAQAHPAHPGP